MYLGWLCSLLFFFLWFTGGVASITHDGNPTRATSIHRTVISTHHNEFNSGFNLGQPPLYACTTTRGVFNLRRLRIVNRTDSHLSFGRPKAGVHISQLERVAIGGHCCTIDLPSGCRRAAVGLS